MTFIFNREVNCMEKKEESKEIIILDEGIDLDSADGLQFCCPGGFDVPFAP